MRTLLGRFSDDFVHCLRPLLAPLEASLAELDSTPLDLPGRPVLPELRELRHQLGVLVEKVEDQHAFVLIFGPLKSGKSTLMNALSAAYVSEVSSLPAYPCMVYVSHSPTKAYEITYYDGRTDVLTDTAALQIHIQRAHTELVQAIRLAEERGDEFDPALHFPQAIRRIDVKLPAGDLEESGAVLVDTPGLYSRMKFGYDRMTRDFRNAAACAIFVVKTDNLFLEQVFEEFNELLDLFSRIFLVVNVDSTKLDLGPGGELIPSLEQQNPLRIVEAFENFAMSAPLKHAADEGRLKIYPIDLLRAASKRMRHDQGTGSEEEMAASGEAFRGQSEFNNFQGDLTEFLNSTDYLLAFMSDSLRRGESLTGELEEVLDGNEVRRLREVAEELETEKQAVSRRLDAVRALSEYGWESSCEELRQRLAGVVREQSRLSAEKTSHANEGALTRWFESDASFQELVADELQPLFESHQVELLRFVHERLDAEAGDLHQSISIGPESQKHLAEADIDLAVLARSVFETVRAGAPEVELGPILTTAQIPVKKKIFWDWVLFRRRSAIRRRLFGPPDRPAIRLPRLDKEARLGREARSAMVRCIDEAELDYFTAVNEAVETSVLAAYTRSVAEALRAELATKESELVQRDAELESRLAEARRVLDGFQKLEEENGRIQQGMAALFHTYVESDELVPLPRETELVLAEPEVEVDEVELEPLQPEPTEEAKPEA